MQNLLRWSENRKPDVSIWSTVKTQMKYREPFAEAEILSGDTYRLEKLSKHEDNFSLSFVGHVS